jgi:LacI family transcriptional regulator
MLLQLGHRQGAYVSGPLNWTDAHDRGLAVPEDLSIVGFDNAPLSRYLYPKLSTVDYPIEDMSRMAVRRVLRNVYGDETVEIVHQFEPKLLPRESSRPVRD